MLTFILAVLRETLRLNPPAAIRTVSPEEDTILSGGYAVKKGALIAVANMIGHRDPNVYGEDANEFNPDRMLDGKFEALPPNAWQVR